MKRLLLSLCLVSAVFPGHNRLALQAPLGPPTSAEQLVEVRAVLSRGPAMQGSIVSTPEFRSSAHGGQIVGNGELEYGVDRSTKRR